MVILLKNDRIEVLLNNMIKNDIFPGASYALLTKNNQYIGSVGNKSLIPQVEPNDINTLYDMASLTKVIVTNTLITRMIYKKLISLNDSVQKYLPQFKYANITIFDLLTHSSGLSADLKLDEITSKQNFFDALFNLKLEYNPHEKVIYSDIGFILLGLIIEKIYDARLDQVAQEEIFKPLNMHDSYYNPTDAKRCAPTEQTKKRGLVQGYVHDEKSYILGGIAGHAGLFSTIKDIVKFCEMIQNNGMVGEKTYLPIEYINLWFTPFKQVDDTQFRSVGWIVGNYDNVTGNLGDMNTIFHTGFTGTSIVINRKEKICAILLTNRVHPTRENNKLIKNRKYFYNECYDIAKSEEKNKLLIK